MECIQNVNIGVIYDIWSFTKDGCIKLNIDMV